MKLAVLTLAAFTMLGLASCKKDYTCECTKTRASETGSVSTKDGVYQFKDTKVRAIDKCNDKETSGTDALGKYTVECDIK